jgi:hypothetical protein
MPGYCSLSKPKASLWIKQMNYEDVGGQATNVYSVRQFQ